MHIEHNIYLKKKSNVKKNKDLDTCLNNQTNVSIQMYPSVVYRLYYYSILVSQIY